MEPQILNQSVNSQAVCGFCQNVFKRSEMYSVSNQCNHGFCFQCLKKQLQGSLQLKEDLKCPVDECMELLSEQSNFFCSIQKPLHDEYIIWKNSPAYRRPTYRKTMTISRITQQEKKEQIVQRLIEKQEQMEIRPQVEELEERLVAEPERQVRVRRESCLSTIFRFILFPFAMIALCIVTFLGLTLCILIYTLCILFSCLIIVSVVGIVFSAIKEQYVFTVLCAFCFVFSIVVTQFYWSNFSDINQIVKAGIKNYFTFSKKLILFFIL